MAVTADPRIGRTARTALMSVRFTQVQIQRPANLHAEDYPPSISLYAVEGRDNAEPTSQNLFALGDLDCGSTGWMVWFSFPNPTWYAHLGKRSQAVRVDL